MMMMIISLFRRDVYNNIKKFNQLISTVDIFNYEMFLSTVIIYSTTKCSFQMQFELISTVVIYSTTKCSFQMWFWLYSTTTCSFQMRLDTLNVMSKILLPLRRHYSNSNVLTHVISNRLERHMTAFTFDYDLASHNIFQDDVAFIRCHDHVW